MTDTITEYNRAQPGALPDFTALYQAVEKANIALAQLTVEVAATAERLRRWNADNDIELVAGEIDETDGVPPL